MTTEKNPILFNTHQAELIQMGLTMLMKAAQERGEDDLFKEAAALSRDFEQNIMRGEGMPPEMRAKFQQRMTLAHQKQDQTAIMRTLRDFLAAMVRMEPDPARTAANVMMNAIMRSNSSQAGDVFIPLVRKKLKGLLKSYEEEGFPPSADVIDYLDRWLDFGHKNLKSGEEAWPNDEHFND